MKGTVSLSPRFSCGSSTVEFLHESSSVLRCCAFIRLVFARLELLCKPHECWKIRYVSHTELCSCSASGVRGLTEVAGQERSSSAPNRPANAIAGRFFRVVCFFSSELVALRRLCGAAAVFHDVCHAASPSPCADACVARSASAPPGFAVSRTPRVV